MAFHSPRCRLTGNLENLLELANFSNANTTPAVPELLKHPALPPAIVYLYREMQSPYVFDRMKGEIESLQRQVAALNIEIARLTSALSGYTEQHRSDTQRLALAGDVQSETVDRGTAPGPLPHLFNRQTMNVDPVCNIFHQDEVYQARSALEYGVHDPHPDAGQVSSVAALPATNIVVDDNSNELGPTVVSIIPPPPPSYHFT